MDVLHTVQLSRFVVLEIFQDDCNESPREWDNLGEMVCSHRRYHLGDIQILTGTEESFDPSEHWGKDGFWLPLYLYDHSGVTMSTTPFSCHWDSGQVGWIGVSRAKIKEEFIVAEGETEEQIRERALQCLRREVETYDQFLRGDVYGFRLLKKGEVEDSCWGFYGTNWKENGILDNLDDKQRKKALAALA